jgi:hypothetical protein
MKRIELNQMEATLGGFDWTGVGVMCGIGFAVAVAATGGAAIPFAGAIAMVGGGACGAYIGWHIK